MSWVLIKLFAHQNINRFSFLFTANHLKNLKRNVFGSTISYNNLTILSANEIDVCLHAGIFFSFKMKTE